MAGNQLYYFHVLILLSAIFFIICTSANADCQYTVHVKTDPRRDAGTDSIISLSLYDNANFSGGGVVVNNLESWGVMGPGHDYFEGGNLDIFSGRAPCLAKPVCFMILKSDGSGNKPGWYVSFVDVFTANRQQHFTVAQWLAVDEPPYSLTVYRNKCGNSKTMNISEDAPLPLSSVV
ncbi:PLAT domain-containing protein 1 [Sesamum angolense]|uniref:PLAT domain-containing protein 1 n=1 Tax=Sesamum angolense TaxID=2727404 RepID=A0AAE1VYF8_9LAMI|nr:PLAT domain-containing protein 1 [Sesamum angolense]